MSFESLIPIALLGCLAVLSLVLPGKRGTYVRYACILFATLFLINHFWSIFSSESRGGQIRAVIQTEKAEIPLRILTTVNIGVAKIYSQFGPLEDKSGHRKTVLEMSTTGMGNFFKSARKAFEESLKAYPDSLNIKTKLVAALAASDSRADKKAIERLCTEMAAVDKPESKEMAAFLKALYIDRHIPTEQVNRDVQLLDAHMTSGWFRDQIKLALFQTAHDKQLYKTFSAELERRYWQTFLRGLSALAVILLAAFVGVVVIVIQLGSLSRRQPTGQEAEPPGAAIELSTVYSVFLAWFITQSAIGSLLKMLPKGWLHLNGDPVAVAAFTMITYIVNMAPALLYIYFLAMRSRKAELKTSLNLPSSPAQFGKQILTGVLAWCAMFPLVISSAAAAGYFGSKGSDNSIIAEIISAANSANIPAIILLYGTLSVLAPLCEELIFRAFLYGSLRRRLGVFASMFLSSLIFAGIHFDKGGFLMLFSIGFVLAFCYERYRNILSCMIGHGLWNCGSFTLALLFFSS